MRRVRWIGLVLLGLVVLYPVALLVGGVALRGPVKRRVAAEIGRALDAEARIEDLSLDLVRGRIVLGGLTVTRHRGGTLDVRLDHAEVRVSPMGLFIVDRKVKRVALEGLEVEISARGVYTEVKRERARRKLTLGQVELTRAHIVVEPTSLLPEVGALVLHIEQARTGQVNLEHALSWIFQLRELRATMKAPKLPTVTVAYTGHTLEVSGGTIDVTMPFQMPPAPEGYELDSVVVLAEALAKSLGRTFLKDRAQRLLERVWKDE